MDDCLIIGGGVIGLSLAWELAGRGKSVRVLDRGRIGREASWAGAGILPPAGARAATHPLDQLRALSDQLHPVWSEKLLAETGVDNGYLRCGGIYLARTAGEAASLAGALAMFAEEGVEARTLDNQELAQLEPGLAEVANSGQLKQTLLLPGEGQIRNPRHLRALRLACESQGVALVEGAEALEFARDDRAIAGVRTTRGDYSAGQYCLAGGAWTGGLLESLHYRHAIEPIRGQMVLFHAVAPPLKRIVNEGPRYLVPRRDGRVLVGSSEEEVGFDKRTTAEEINALIDFARRTVPSLHKARIERVWAGLRPGVEDGAPYLGRLSGLENAFIAAGHFRSGLFLSPATAVVMADAMCGQTPAVDLGPFRVSRAG